MSRAGMAAKNPLHPAPLECSRQSAEGRKQRAVGGKQMLFILAPESCSSPPTILAYHVLPVKRHGVRFGPAREARGPAPAPEGLRLDPTRPGSTAFQPSRFERNGASQFPNSGSRCSGLVPGVRFLAQHRAPSQRHRAPYPQNIRSGRTTPKTQHTSAESRFSETLRVFLQIRPPSSAGSSTRSIARVRFGPKVALRPAVQSCTLDHCRTSARLTRPAPTGSR